MQQKCPGGLYATADRDGVKTQKEVPTVPPLAKREEGIGGSLAFMTLPWGLGSCLAMASAEFPIL